jgi:LmbE family N-acetylglucosaminyl deacetylase
MSSSLTIMAVRAHPDDEASTTGGVLARYADEGARVVLVTCTDGRMGDGPGGVKPGEPGHDIDLVVATRRQELERSCQILGVTDLELLGYRDSGMMGWPGNDAPESFWQTPVEEAAARLGQLMRHYQPQIVVTYDATGFYGHPDHIQAHRITEAAFHATGVPLKLYHPAIPQSRWEHFAQMIAEAQAESPTSDGGPQSQGEPEPGGQGQGQEGGRPLVLPDEDFAAILDCRPWVERKREALAAHAGQLDNAWLLGLGDRFADVFGHEAFIRAEDRTGAPVPEDDLFAGLRNSVAS